MFKTFWTLKIIDIFFIIVWILLSLVVVIALVNNTPILIAIAVIGVISKSGVWRSGYVPL